jgi:hypothetical protein
LDDIPAVAIAESLGRLGSRSNKTRTKAANFQTLNANLRYLCLRGALGFVSRLNILFLTSDDLIAETRLARLGKARRTPQSRAARVCGMGSYSRLIVPRRRRISAILGPSPVDDSASAPRRYLARALEARNMNRYATSGEYRNRTWVGVRDEARYGFLVCE